MELYVQPTLCHYLDLKPMAQYWKLFFGAPLDNLEVYVKLGEVSVGLV